MSDLAIKVEDVSKIYRLGQIGTGTFKNDLVRFWHKFRGKEDPFTKIGATNIRDQKAASEWVWALKNINFEVNKGEVLGIIGRNGAGKSTLLKILSKITSPTKGQITINGRIASLLEVGTGFHPELSGRDNIFLNGAILGMKKWEIQKKFDEIVDFSGVEAYVDTPVKRYSSGMYVRLAFAVAAYLEPEILIVDEVLAVGDADFQKKCLGRMKDVSVNDGRTVLFVSHNMGAIQKLCNQTLFLENGLFVMKDQTAKVIDKYLNASNFNSHDVIIDNKNVENLLAYTTRVVVTSLNDEIFNEIPVGKPWKVSVYFTIRKRIEGLVVALGINDVYDTAIRTSWSDPVILNSGQYVATFIEENITLSPGRYKLIVGISKEQKNIHYVDNDIYLNISDVVYQLKGSIFSNKAGFIMNPMQINLREE